MSPSPTARMSVEDRREQLLDVATRVFARNGYHGTRAESVAQQAGVSQPYVFRIFGTKLNLFLQVFARATDRVRLALEEVLDEGPFDPDSDDDAARLVAAYTLLPDRDLLQVIMHGWATGGVEAIAEQGRASLAEILRTIRRTGWDPERCRDFIAHGLLMSVMVSMRAPEHLSESSELDLLSESIFGDTLACRNARSGRTKR
jgi:AcrR family transcriptional regulator